MHDSQILLSILAASSLATLFVYRLAYRFCRWRLERIEYLAGHALPEDQVRLNLAPRWAAAWLVRDLLSYISGPSLYKGCAMSVPLGDWKAHSSVGASRRYLTPGFHSPQTSDKEVIPMRIQEKSRCGLVALNFRVPLQLRRQLRRAAAELDVTMTSLILEALQEISARVLPGLNSGTARLSDTAGMQRDP